MILRPITKQVSIKTSTKKAVVEITSLTIVDCDMDKDFGELRVEFDTAQCNVNKEWLRDFMRGLVNEGFDAKAANDMDFPEEVIQGDNFVSLEIGNLFIVGWEQKYGELEFDEEDY